MNLFVTILESIAKASGYVADTVFDTVTVDFYHSFAVQFAELLSAGARIFFGV